MNRMLGLASGPSFLTVFWIPPQKFMASKSHHSNKHPVGAREVEVGKSQKTRLPEDSDTERTCFLTSTYREAQEMVISEQGPFLRSWILSYLDRSHD